MDHGSATAADDRLPEATVAVTEARALWGARAQPILDLAVSDASLARVFGASTLAAAVLFSVRDEMAVTLSDVIFRRTALGDRGPLPRSVLGEVARLMAAECHWSATETDRQVEAVVAAYQRVSMAGNS